MGKVTCLRCRTDTRDPATGGWWYRRGQLRGLEAAQLRPRCLRTLR